MALVCFSHGKESGPKATKISALSRQAEAAGHQTLSVDYRGMDRPSERVEKLYKSLDAHPAAQGSLVLVGSSMGAFVSLVASAEIAPVGLFLMAPAVYMPGYEKVPPPPKNCLTQIYHGWSDEIVPVENAIRYAREHHLEALLLEDDHRLSHSMPILERHFAEFLSRLI